jgi:hypothetical protein
MTLSCGSSHFLRSKRMNLWSVLLSSLLLAIVTRPAVAAQTQATRKGTELVCGVASSAFDGASEIQDLKDYKQSIVALLESFQFGKLDCIADSARTNKERLPGGLWTLHNLYGSLEEPEGHATAEDWNTRLSLLNKWVAERPNSITAHVALAGTYQAYAWDARGNGMSDTVTDSGWRLFTERLEKAKAILDADQTLTEKCPESYVIRQQIAQSQGIEQETAVLKKATAFDPTYYYYYRIHANLLLPKWFGEDGDASRFAAESADHVGGTDGDILYFQIAGNLACPCDEPEINRMSWDRIKRGFVSAEEKYGSSAVNLNLFALMATKFDDSEAADSAFKKIGDNWDEGTWHTRAYFDQTKSWVAQVAAFQARTRALIQEAAANEQSPNGEHYKEEVQKRFATFVHGCVAGTEVGRARADYLLQIGKDGNPQNGYVPNVTQATFALMACINKALMTAQITDQKPFPVPPHDSYWLKLQIDPSLYKASN